MPVTLTIEGIDREDLTEGRRRDDEQLAEHVHRYLQEGGYDVEAVAVEPPADE